VFLFLGVDLRIKQTINCNLFEIVASYFVYFVVTAGMVCGAGFMHLSGVRPSVCSTAANRLLQIS